MPDDDALLPVIKVDDDDNRGLSRLIQILTRLDT